MTRIGQNVELYTGDDRDLVVTIYSAVAPSTSVLDITLASAATYTVRDVPGGTAFITKTIAAAGIALTTPASGILTISIASADTASMVGERDYYHELELVLSAKIATCFTGRFRLHKSVSGTGA